MFISLARILRFSFQDIRRNVWLSLATTLVLVLTLFSINSLIILNFLMNSVRENIENKIDVSLYFKPDVSSERVREVRTILGKVQGIVSIKLIEPEEALAYFEERYSKDTAVLDALKIVEKNPFGTTLVVKASDPTAYKDVLSTIQKGQYDRLISDQTFEDHAFFIEKVDKITSRINRWGIGFSAFFAVVALIIAMTAVRVAVYTHRETIGIMKLVGASNWFVRLPYVFQGFFFAVVSVGITLGIMYPLLHVVEPRLASVFGGEALRLGAYFKDSLPLILGVELGAATVVNSIVMSVAVGRYLKV